MILICIFLITNDVTCLFGILIASLMQCPNLFPVSFHSLYFLYTVKFLPNPRSQTFFSLEVLTFLALRFSSVVHFKLILYMMQGEVKEIHSPHIDIQLFQHLLERLSFSPFNYLSKTSSP